MKFRPNLHKYTILILAVLVSFVASIAAAETYTIKVTSNGQPLAGVAIYGTHGINDLAGRITDSEGSWAFDSSVVSSSSFVVGFSHSSKSYRFEPAELTPSVARCPGRICQVDAIQDGNPTALVRWTVLSSTGQPLANMPVTLAGAEYPCPKFTDQDGYVIFAVRKHAIACNDGDIDLNNNNYKLVNLQPNGKSCTFTTALSKKFNVCTSGGDFEGYTTATCTNASALPVGESVNYQIVVTQDNGIAVTGVNFYGVPSLENLSTDSLGKISFSTSQIGASPADIISLIPVGSGYQFQPPRLDISPNSCANNICRVTAFKNGQAQGVLRSYLSGSGAPLSAVEIEGSDKFLCSQHNRSISDQAGNAYLPVLVKESCNVSDNNPWNDPFAFSATREGCSFTHSSQTPFQVCPSQIINNVTLNAFCGSNLPTQYSISGRVFDRDGFPLNQAEILNNDLIVAHTDQSGNYSIIVDESSTPRLLPKYEDLVFDPSNISISQVSKNYENINFYAVAPDSGGSFAPPPINPCPAKPKYEVSGYVFDKDGSPLEGARILNNHNEVATTNQFGAYSFDAEPQEDLWVSAEFEGDMYLEPDGANFDPSAYGYPFNMCDRPEVNFRRTEAISHFLYGKVTDLSGGYPIANAQVILEYEGLTRTVTSNLEGEYLHTVPDGVTYTVRAELAGHIFAPISYDREDADMSFFNYDFNSHISYAPTPTPTFTPTNTATPTNTPTATMTHPPAATYTPSNTPTATNTFTPSNTPTNTATQTNTSMPTSTIRPSDPDLNLMAKLIRAPTGGDLSPNLQIHDFNDRGEIIGASDEYPNNPTPGYGYPLLYSNGEWTQLSSTLRMSLLKINNNGDVVGQSITSGNIGIMYLPSGSTQWQKISSTILLPNGYSFGYVRDINNNGELLVNTYKGASSKVQILVIINPNTGTITEVPNPVGIDIVRVAKFNDARQIVIEAMDPNSPAPGFSYNGRRGFYWDSATGHVDLGLNVIPTGISESGEVVGNIDAANPNNTSFFTFTKLQGVRNIGDESDFVGSYVYGSSSNGEAVLRGRESSGVTRYYIWNPISGLQLLGYIDCEHSYRPGFILFINSNRELIGTASWQIGSFGSYAYYLLSVGNMCNTPLPTNTPTHSPTSTQTITPTHTPTHTATNTFTVTRTHTPSATPTNTKTSTNTPTPSSTFTPSSTPTSTNTSTPTRTSTPTATPNYKLRLTSMCSEDPSNQLKWRVTSEFPYEVQARWDVYGTSQTGNITLAAYGETFFFTDRVKNNSNTVRLFIDSKQMDVKASSLQQCPTPTPTSSPTATSTPTTEPDDVICHVPKGHPESAKTMKLPRKAAEAHLREHDTDYPGPCRDITPTPLPTSTNTATPTKNPEFIISGELKGKNGRKLTTKDMNRLLAGNVTVVVKNMVGDKQSYRQQLLKPFTYSFSVPAGYYKVWIEADRKFLKVTSLPRQYTNWVLTDNKGFNFGVQISNPAQKRSR